jgi:hypothetical protein
MQKSRVTVPSKHVNITKQKMCKGVVFMCLFIVQVYSYPKYLSLVKLSSLNLILNFSNCEQLFDI